MIGEQPRQEPPETLRRVLPGGYVMIVDRARGIHIVTEPGPSAAYWITSSVFGPARKLDQTIVIVTQHGTN